MHFQDLFVTPSCFNTSMNKQLQLLEIEIEQNNMFQADKKFSKRRLGKGIEEKLNLEKPWKLSEVDRNQGLAGIAMIKKILASAPNNFDIASYNEDALFAKAS